MSVSHVAFWEAVMHQFAGAMVAYRLPNEAKVSGGLANATSYCQIAAKNLKNAQQEAKNAPAGWRDIGKQLQHIAQDWYRLIGQIDNMQPGNAVQLRENVSRIVALDQRSKKCGTSQTNDRAETVVQN